MKRRRTIATAACLAFTLLTASCGQTALRTGSAPRRAPATNTVLRFAISTWGTTWSYNLFNSSFLPVAYDVALLPLAFQTPPKLTTFVPQVAKSWSVHDNTLVVHLRPGLRWQNGQPLTSKDVYDSIVLGGTDGGAWADLRNVSTPSPSTVSFALRSGVPATLAEDAILGVEPVPSSLYGRFVTPQLKEAEVTNANLQVTNERLLKEKYGAAAQQKLAAGVELLSAAEKAKQTAVTKELAAAFQRVEKFHPATLVGDGPFKLVSANVSGARFVKWNGFYLAKNVHLAGIDFLSMSGNQAIYGAVLGGRADIPSVYMPSSIVKKVLQAPDMHLTIAPFGGEEFGFNNRRFPLNLPAVRQALTYVIPRKNMVLAAYGGVDAGGIAVTPPDGMLADMQTLWLSKAERARLNDYPVSDAKAARLLRSAGLRKVNGSWHLPDGKPFTLTLSTVSGYSDTVQSFEVAASALSNFGIKANVDGLPDGAALVTAEEKGDYDIGWFGMANTSNPLAQLDGLLGRGNDYPLSGSYAGDPGLGFGPRADVPGLGSVSVPDAIDQEVSSVAPGGTMRQLVWDWARLLNQQLPYVVYAQAQVQWAYSSSRITDWPPASSKLWVDLGAADPGGIVLMFERGYLRPKS